MKQFILTTVLLSIITLTHAQVNMTGTEPVNDKNFSQKSKNQKTAAWVCIGGGAALITTGLAIGSKKVAEDVVNLFSLQNTPQHNYAGENICLIAGGAAMLSSIPLFIASNKNHRKARLTVKEEKVALGLPIKAGKKISGISLVIPIGR